MGEMVIKLMVSNPYPALCLFTPNHFTGAGYDQIMRKFGICRDYAKVCLNVPYGTLPKSHILYQGACQSDAQSCRYKHRSPMDLDIGNERTTWEDVRAREEVVCLNKP